MDNSKLTQFVRCIQQNLSGNSECTSVGAVTRNATMTAFSNMNTVKTQFRVCGIIAKGKLT